jgi:hypothetical protein
MGDKRSFLDASTNGKATLATSRRSFIAGWKLCAGVALGLCLAGRSSLAGGGMGGNGMGSNGMGSNGMGSNGMGSNGQGGRGRGAVSSQGPA